MIEDAIASLLAGVFGGFLVYMGTNNWWLTVFAFLISATLFEMSVRRR